MPRYAILIYEDEAGYKVPAAVDEVMREHDAFKQRNRVLPGGIGLLPSSSACSLRRDSRGTLRSPMARSWRRRRRWVAFI